MDCPKWGNASLCRITSTILALGLTHGGRNIRAAIGKVAGIRLSSVVADTLMAIWASLTGGASLMTAGKFLSLHDFDGEFIVISLAANAEDAVLHFAGDQATLVDLLKGAHEAILDAESEPLQRLN
jgi:hypothetical protein